MKAKFFVLLVSATCFVSVSPEASGNTTSLYHQGDAADCSTVTVLSGHKSPGGCYTMKIRIDNNCKTGITIKADYGYRGRYADKSEGCSGGENERLVGYVSSGEEGVDKSIVECTGCTYVDSAWITNTYAYK